MTLKTSPVLKSHCVYFVYNYVTGFAKPIPIGTTIEIQFMA